MKRISRYLSTALEAVSWMAAFPVMLAALAGLQLALKVNAGNDIQARVMGGDVVGFTGTSSTGSPPTSTTLTDSGSPGWTVNAFAGHVVYTGAVYGIIVSNTASVLTVDRWYTPGTPGGAAATTPAGTLAYTIGTGGHPGWFMGLTANAVAAGATDTSLSAEIVTSGGGLIRKICPYAHSAGVASYTLTPVFTANGSDSLPVVIAKMGVFVSMVVGDTTSTMLFETIITPTTATLSASGDALTITETVSM